MTFVRVVEAVVVGYLILTFVTLFLAVAIGKARARADDAAERQYEAMRDTLGPEAVRLHDAQQVTSRRR